MVKHLPDDLKSDTLETAASLTRATPICIPCTSSRDGTANQSKQDVNLAYNNSQGEGGKGRAGKPDMKMATACGIKEHGLSLQMLAEALRSNPRLAMCGKYMLRALARWYMENHLGACQLGGPCGKVTVYGEADNAPFREQRDWYAGYQLVTNAADAAAEQCPPAAPSETTGDEAHDLPPPASDAMIGAAERSSSLPQRASSETAPATDEAVDDAHAAIDTKAASTVRKQSSSAAGPLTAAMTTCSRASRDTSSCHQTGRQNASMSGTASREAGGT